MNEQQRKKIRRAVLAHEEYKAKWVKDDRFFSVTWISPLGKEETYSGYCSAVNKHLDGTADKIEKILVKP